MTRPACTLISYPYALNDPTPRNAAISFRDAGYDVTIITHRRPQSILSPVPEGITVREGGSAPIFERLGMVGRVLRWRDFRATVRRTIRDTGPEVIVVVQHHGIAALPEMAFRGSSKLVACIYDIQPLEDAGRLDRTLLHTSWERLSRFDVVWASDRFRGELAQSFARLTRPPITCHNCPRDTYLTPPLWPRDGWLRETLRSQGMVIPDAGGCILLRAGAVGPCGGLEETLDVMPSLPEDFVFLIMGRPDNEYVKGLTQRIARQGLTHRVMFWDRPADDIWDRALRGADIGHMVHGPFPPGAWQRLHEHNSSLSNYRLYNYMAAGLPIVVHRDSRMEDLVSEVDCFRIARHESLAADLANVYRELNDSPTLREELGRRARTAHERVYHWEHQFAQILNALGRRALPIPREVPSNDK